MDFPDDEIPNVPIVHYAFQIMVSLGGLMMMAGVFFFFTNWKKKQWMEKRFFWKVFAFLAPAGFIALEAGWIVTEVGRQPWIIHKIMRTKDAVTPMPGIVYSFYMYVLVYTILTVAVTWLMVRQIKALNETKIEA